MSYPVWLPLGNSLPLLPTQPLKPNQPAQPDKPLSPSAKLEQGLQTLSKVLDRAKSGSALDFRAFEDAYIDLLKTESEIFHSDAYKTLSPDEKKKFKALGELLREDILRPFKRWQRLQSDLQAPPPTQQGDLQKYIKDREYYLKEEDQVKDNLKEIIRLKGQTPEKILEADLKKLETDFEKTAATELKPLQADLDKAKKDYQTVMDEEYQFAQALQKKKEKYAQVEGYIQKPLRDLEEEYQARLKRFRADEAANRGRVLYQWDLIHKDHKEQLKKLEAELRLKYDPEHSALKEEIERDEVTFNKMKANKAQKGLIVDEKTLAFEKKKDLLTLPIQERQLAYQEELLAQEKQALIRKGTMTSAGKYTGNGDDYLAFVEYGKKSMTLMTERKRLENLKKGIYQVPSGLAGLEAKVQRAQGDVKFQNDQIAKIQGQLKARYDNFSPLQELPEGFNMTLAGSTLTMKDVAKILNANRGEANLLNLWQPNGISPAHIDEALKRLKDLDYLGNVMQGKGFPPETIQAAKDELAKESKTLIPLLEAMKKDFKAFDADGNGVITLGDIPKFSSNNLAAIKTKILSLKDDELEQMKKAIGAEGAPIQTLVSSGLGDDRIKEELAKKANELFKDYLGIQK